MNPDVFITIAFVLYAAVIALGGGAVLFAISRHQVDMDAAAEDRYSRFCSRSEM